MSLITAFPFHAYVGDLKTRATVEAKRSVSLSIFGSDDVARMAFVEVRTRCGHEDRSAPWRPVVRRGEEYATFYDTRMGNFDLRTFPTQPCTTCAASGGGGGGRHGNERCHGHFGLLRMPRRHPGDPQRGDERLYVLNPHLAAEVEQLLQAQCFFCCRFRAAEFDVERFRLALHLVDRGHVAEALHLLDTVANARGQEQRHKRKRDPNERVISDVAAMREHVDRILARHPANRSSDGKAVHDIRHDIARQAVKELRECSKVCSHCHAISPRITSKNSHLFFFFNKKSAEFNVAFGKLTPQQLREWEETNRRHRRSHTYFRSDQIRECIKQLCKNEAPMLGALFPHLGEPSFPDHIRILSPMPAKRMYKVFFLDKLLVPPLSLRLSSGVQVQDSGTISPDPKTRALSDVLGFVEQLEVYYGLKDASTPEKNHVTEDQEVAYEVNLRSLQAKINEVYTMTLESFAKKEGLFRMHMMGKRVNQACRSVISPDFLVEPDEVLLPRPFSRNLSFPEQVAFYAPARVQFLKKCVINGPHRYPGATHLELCHASGEVKFVDLNVPEQTRRQHAEKYFALAQSGGTLTVHRHIVTGDRVIFNRQPTLHKASMMGYRVRVLSGLKTLRFHYVNGKSYNADFDGDEMNIHVPQSLEARAELECLMDADLNFLVPTSGKPIRGLIQDHVAAGVLLTVRDKFLDRHTFSQLLIAGLSPYLQQHQRTSFLSVAQRSLSEMIPVPAVLKPRPLWTGKQLLSSLLKYVTGSFPGDANDGVTVRGTSLIQPAAYTTTDRAHGMHLKTMPRDDMGDDTVVFMGSELIRGVIDKNQLGPSAMSMAHVIHEIFGPHVVGQLFGALGRVLTFTLQREGFSIGLDDLMLVLEDRRRDLLRRLDNAPLQPTVGGADDDEEAKAMQKIMELSTQLQKEFVPGRMLVPFPRNQLLMMTVSGAKGSNTNTIQMALGLGQQLFDGRRVKRMNSGKTLPAFFIGERRARSFGYAMGRFASGIRPPEYTIHAMAGRDGLIDTAVKTSRSGHLQRCLIKGLESLVVQWDHSVRDSNGSVIQFRYGGDGMDPCKASTLTSWEMTKNNLRDMAKKYMVDIGASGGAEEGDGDETGAGALRNENGKRPLGEDAVVSTGMSKGLVFGATSSEVVAALHAALENDEAANPLPHALQKSLSGYLEREADFVLFKKVSQVVRWNARRSTLTKLAEKRREFVDYYRDVMTEIATRRRTRSFCEAGEPVGLLAAQAAGEPSTQMTLNTFHSAGSTVTHVTEGIPRLRELLIHASVQKAAVIVPVVGAQAADEETIARIIRAATPCKLTDCMAPIFRGRSDYEFRVDRRPDATVVELSLAFSQMLVQRSQLSMCMSPEEHQQAFLEGLRALTRRIVFTLRGRSKGDAAERPRASDEADAAMPPLHGGRGNDDDHDGSDDDDHDGGGGAGALRKPVQDPYDLLGSDDDPDLGSDDDHGTGRKRTADRRTCMRRKRRSGLRDKLDSDDSNGDDEEAVEEDEMAASQSDVAPTPVETPALRSQQCDPHGGSPEELSDAEDAAVGLGPVGFTYSTFPAIRMTLGGNKFHVDIAPLPATPQLATEFFVVRVAISMPANVVAVIPDVVNEAMRRVNLPTWLPQFDSVTFTRSSGDATSGELVFQGPTATIRNVATVVSLFNVRSSAIRLERAHSTDIQDMVTSLGVESGYRALFEELQKLFKRYAVDHRHLSLIADAATNRGTWENYNFTGVIARGASPLFQMTFASSKRFLHTAVTRGMGDDLRSISSAIMVGERPRVGTACTRVYQHNAALKDVFERP